MTKKTQIRKLKSKPLFRVGTFNREQVDTEARTVELAFSSEEPVERWFGQEILDHSPTSVRLGRLQDGGPILVDHDHRDHVGVIESVSIDKDRRGRATVRFGQSERAMEIFNDVVDGIRKSVSVGYRIHKAVLEETGDESADVYRVNDWEPYEVSIVSVPADATVGVGRGADNEENEIIFEEPKKEERIMSEVNAPAETPVDVQAIESAARQAELDRIREINTIADNHNAADLARTFIDNGKSAGAFREAVLERYGITDAVEAEAPDIGMSERDLQQFSFVRALNYLANPNDPRAIKAAGFEIECSSAASERSKKDAAGIMIPADVLKRSLQDVLQKRDLTVGTTTAGGHTVATDLLSGSFIEMLRNRAVLMQPGMATVMTDLNGNIAIPRQTGGATSYWVAESGAPTESQQAFDQVTLSPNTVGAFTDYSRKLLLQSSIDVEAFVRGDLAKALALAIDLAGINGSGASNQPTGILNTTGIGDVAGGTNGLAPTFAHMVNLETEVAQDNADVGSLRYLTNTKVRGKLKQTEKASNTAQFVWNGNEVNGYEAMVTNQVPSDLDKGTSLGVCSAVIFGNFADLLIGMWGGLDLTVDPFTASTSGTVRVVALQDVDVAVRHAESFAAMLDALTN